MFQIAGNPMTRERASPSAWDGSSWFGAFGPPNNGPLVLIRYLPRLPEQALRVIGGVSEEQLSARHSIQGYDVSVLEAIYRVVEHFSMHTGQIIFITKLLTTADLGFYRHLESAAGTTAP
jgi:Protein of unknown function (DUF1572)